MTDVMPAAPADLSAEFLTVALRKSGVLPAGRVASFELSSVGDAGQTGDVVRIALRYEAPGPQPQPPPTLIAKFASPFPQARAQMHALGLYEREVRFYQDFGADPGIAVPRCHYARIDSTTGDFALLLEDVGEGRGGDFWHGSVPDAEVALRHLGAFHAKWWEHPQLHATAWLRKPNDLSYYRDMLGPMLAGCIPVAGQKFPAERGGYLLRTAQRLVERWNEFVGAPSLDRCTLVHTDYHPKQMFYPRDDGRGRFAVFDWQGTCVMRGAVDVQRVLLMHLQPDQLRAQRDRLIALYAAALGERGVQQPLDQLLTDTQRAALWTVWVTVFALATTDLDILHRDASANHTTLHQRIFVELQDSLEQLQAYDQIP